MLGTTSIDDLETTVLEAEAAVSALRAIQVEALHRLDEAGIANIDGARSIVEWTTAKLDIAPENAKALVQASRIITDEGAAKLRGGECSFDRVLATARLCAAGADDRELAFSAGFDIAGVRRLTARLRRFTRYDERRVFADQHVVLQPNLDESQYSIRGLIDGVGGRTIEKALLQRSDELPDDMSSRAHRYALSLTSICQDSLDGSADGDSTGSSVVLFADLDRVAQTGGEAGAETEIEFGLRAGPAVLEEALCAGSVQLIGLRGGKPVVTTDATKAIPPAILRFVKWRDGGCTIDGCRSRYRLQVHHIKHRAHHGDNDPDNLTTLCWFHHHVVIHRRGFTFDPHSPPQRRRLIPPRRRGPPQNRPA